jgi:hypothetical protein
MALVGFYIVTPSAVEGLLLNSNTTVISKVKSYKFNLKQLKMCHNL